ncbi:fimbrillin family protein [uncultured Bacteroides sp.]|uniref:fimbrillin family protein n=1 Tax=uncultured Bacteroides sp. TaxID=162156 RepID=UPI0025DA5CC0|nr:fimbrillin family protein [uncultured Bacteroides sp.]
MKKLKYTLLLLVAALTGLSSCSKEDDLLSSQNISAEPVIKVSTTGYESANPTTRATDNEDEFKTTLAENDQIGIYAVKDGKVISKNVCYRYNNSSKTWEKVGTEAVSAISGSNVSFFAYYPYRQAMDGKTIASIADIISNFEVAADQSTHELYTNNDLMTATGTLSADKKTLSFTLQHSLALIVLDLKGQRTPYSGGYAAYGAVSSIAEKKIGNVTTPYTDSKGCFRALVKPGSVTPAISYSAGGKTVTYSSVITAVAGKYNKKLIYAGNTTDIEKSIARGDYFYADGNISSTYTNDSSNPCIGIVLTTSEQLAAAPYNHGLVVALKDAARKFSHGGQNIPTDNLPQVPNTCQKWFGPTIDQLKLMIWGNTTSQSTDGKTFLEDKMNGVANSEKFNARSLENVFYSSTEFNNNYWTIVVSNGKQQEWFYGTDANGRAIFAF